MSERQNKQLEEIIFSWHVEGQDVTFDEQKNLKSIFEGKRTYKEVISQYLTEENINV